MGTWDASIFGGDLALDVKAAYEELLAKDGNSDEIVSKLTLQFAESIEDEDENSVFWLALAGAQLEHGEVSNKVAESALEIIASGQGLKLFSENKELLELRKEVLLKLKNQLLNSDLSAHKQVSLQNFPPTNWQEGEVVGYRMKSDKLLLLRMCGTEELHGENLPVFELLEYSGSEFPSIDVLETLALKPVSSKNYPTEPPLGKHGMKMLKVAGKVPIKMSYEEYVWNHLRPRFTIGFVKGKDFDTNLVIRKGDVSKSKKNRLKKTGMTFSWNFLGEQIEELFFS